MVSKVHSGGGSVCVKTILTSFLFVAVAGNRETTWDTRAGRGAIYSLPQQMLRLRR